MADENEAQRQEGGGKAGSKKLIIILAAVIVLLLVVGGGAAWFFLMNDEVADSAPAAAQEVRKEAIYVKLRTMGGKPAFIANFNETKHRHRFLQIYAEALTRDEAVVEDLKKHMPLVVHALTKLFSDQRFVDLQTTEGKEQLREAATKAVQDILQKESGRPGVEAVYFTNFVMQ